MRYIISLTMQNSINHLSNSQAARQSRTFNAQQIHEPRESLFFLNHKVLEGFSYVHAPTSAQFGTNTTVVE